MTLLNLAMIFNHPDLNKMLYSARGHDRKLPSRLFYEKKKVSVGVSHNKNIVRLVAYVNFGCAIFSQHP
jgi:hypothetical protein